MYRERVLDKDSTFNTTMGQASEWDEATIRDLEETRRIKIQENRAKEAMNKRLQREIHQIKENYNILTQFLDTFRRTVCDAEVWDVQLFQPVPVPVIESEVCNSDEPLDLL